MIKYISDVEPGGSRLGFGLLPGLLEPRSDRAAWLTHGQQEDDQPYHFLITVLSYHTNYELRLKIIMSNKHGAECGALGNATSEREWSVLNIPLINKSDFMLILAS